MEIGLHAHALYPIGARIRDVLLGSLALILFLPIILGLGLAARRSTGGSALFRQKRLGKDGRPFIVQKLRTLDVKAPADVQKRDAEHLATPLGHLLRRFKIDELPQLWNVLKGDMSLIGPRPIIPEEYSDGEQPLRLAVRPGLTGLWQLSRVREQPFDINPEYDLFYLANRTLVFDFWLMWRTVLLIVSGRETKIRLAARLWERNKSWRELVPDRARSIPEREGPLRSRLYAVVVVVLAGLICAPGIALAFSARGDLTAAQRSLTDARRLAIGLEPQAARARLTQARLAFDEAESKLSSWATLGMRAFPGLNNNIEVPLTFSRMGDSLVSAGHSALDLLDALPFQGGRPEASFAGGTLDLAPFTAADRPARELQIAIDEARDRVSGTPDTFLLPAVAQARSSTLLLLDDAARQAEAVAGAAFLVPRLFGSTGPRTWIIGAENIAELRGRSGYIGSLGTLTADAGRLQLADFRPTSGLPRLNQDDTQAGTIDEEFRERYFALGGSVAWQNLLMSPDFPTGARMLLANLGRVAGMPADGVIGMDPVALSYLLEATGPVEVPGIPERLDAGNIVDWSLNRIYFLSEENDERKELLSVIAGTVWARLLSDPNLDVPKVANAIGRALSERHLVMYSSRPDEQAVIENLGIGGHVDQAEGDYLLLVGQNVAENKMDYYMARDIAYTASLRSDGDLDVELRTTVTHTAPAGTAFPAFVGGSRADLPSGHIRNFLSAFVPERAQLQQVLKNGEPTTDFDNQPEQGKRRLSTYVQVAPGESQTVTFLYRVPDAVRNARYALSVQNQATVRPDNLSVRIQVPEEARLRELQGFRSTGGNLVWEGSLTSDMELSAHIDAPVMSEILNEVVDFLRTPVTSSASG